MFKSMCYVKLRADITYVSRVKETYAGRDEKLARRSKGIFLWPIITALTRSGSGGNIVLFKTLEDGGVEGHTLTYSFKNTGVTMNG